MENVVTFNNELSGLYDTKPPISKAKMAAITRAAMKAIKFYKHVVQSVEKFILKCKPEYKVPGLYVIDSIVRQSRHQFGPEKDVFAPRFARNMKQTFANLFRCAPEDKSRIIRVLNLWQKNSVFAPDVIQPLFDLADPNHPIYQQAPPAGVQDVSAISNGLNTSAQEAPQPSAPEESHGLSAEMPGNNLTQLLKDPNVLRQLQTLQKLKQQEEKQIKLNEMRIQEEAFDKHLQNVLKGNCVQPQTSAPPAQPAIEVQEKEVEFVAEDDKIEVINLDGNDSRSTSPDRERYKRRRSSRSRSRDRGRDRDRRRRSRSRSRSSRSRSPKTNRRRGSSRERDRNKEKEREKEKEKEREYERERRRKGLPDIKKEHLSVCSTTLWVGHLSKLVQQEELSDTFGKYGDIVSIDMIHPRGCAFIVMNRRQDAFKAMGGLKNHKMQGRAITISWAAGKGVKSKEWKDYWDLDLGVSYIPWSKIDKDTDLEALEEGGMFDEDSMPDWMKERINQKKENKEMPGVGTLFGNDALGAVDTTQPPPAAGTMIPGVQMVPQFSMSAVPRLMPPMGVPMPGNMVPGLPMPPNMVPGIPPPHMMIPPGSMVPGFPPMPPMDKSIPPPSAGQSETPTPIPSPFIMSGLASQQPPPNFGGLSMAQFQQPPGSVSNSGTNQNDDHMDIEMEDENPTAITKPMPINFSQPPPLFSAFGEALPNQVNTNPGNNDGRRNDRDMLRDDRRGGDDYRNRDRDMHGGDFNNRQDRDRNRWGNDRARSNDRDHQQNSRMGNDKINENRDFNRSGGGMGQDQNRSDLPQIWRDNFQNQQNFNERRGGGGMNLPNVDLQNPPPHHRPHEFFDMRRDEFNHEDRRGMQRDFFSNMGGGNMGNLGNMGNRFGPPPGAGRGAPMPPMRGGPPPPFGPRLGPMFIRGPARPGPPAAPFAFNDRPPFDREERGGRSRGNMQEMRGGRGNWQDDEEGGGGGGGGGGGRRGNRFQNRDRGNRFNDREDRKGRNDRERDRNDRDRDRDNRRRGDRDRDRGGRNRRSNSRHGEEENLMDNIQTAQNQLPPDQLVQDTEEDWDQELSEHNVGEDFGNQSQDPKDTRENNDFSQDDFKGFESQQPGDMITTEANDDNACSFNEDEFKQKTEASASMQDDGDEESFPAPAASEFNQERRQSNSGNFGSTPLYDEQQATGGSEKPTFQDSEEFTEEALPPGTEEVEESNN